jgi:hypothetical protein
VKIGSRTNAGNQKWPKLNTLETKMAKISHTEIKQPSIGEKRPKLTHTKISDEHILLLIIKAKLILQ